MLDCIVPYGSAGHTQLLEFKFELIQFVIRIRDVSSAQQSLGLVATILDGAESSPRQHYPRPEIPNPQTLVQLGFLSGNGSKHSDDSYHSTAVGHHETIQVKVLCTL